jgi:hypothetical protein
MGWKQGGWISGRFWLMRIVLLALLLMTYLGALRPGRAVFVDSVAAPALAAIDTDRAAAYRMNTAGRVLELRARGAPSIQTRRTRVTYHVPFGILFILPASFLTVLAPHRPFWVYLLGWHGVMCGVGLTAVAAGLAWGDWGFDLYTLIHAYVVPMTSLGATPLAIAAVRRTSFLSESG